MLTYKKSFITTIIIIYILSMIHYTSACLITFMNDTDQVVYILDKTNQILVPVKKNERRRLGSVDRYVYFDIFIREQYKRILTLAYTCEQYICSANGNVLLKFSDIKNHTEAIASFLTIIEHAPYLSMAENVVSHIRNRLVHSE